jgi:hypothetical protein
LPSLYAAKLRDHPRHYPVISGKILPQERIAIHCMTTRGSRQNEKRGWQSRSRNMQDVMMISYSYQQDFLLGEVVIAHYQRALV